jgi:hypothetical protein
MNLQRIYETLKKEYESRGIEIEEGKLRQMAWVKRDRMLFESSMLSTSAAAAAAGAAGAGGGGGSGNRRSVVGAILTESGFPLLTESGVNIVIE